MRLSRRPSGGTPPECKAGRPRQYRSNQAAGDGRDAPNPTQKDTSRTMTGAEQESWLLNGLAASGATWNVLAQQVFFAQRDFDTSAGELYAMDAWDGYLGSRNRIMNFIRDRRIRNPVVITGDVHNNWACNLKADFYNQRTATLGVEFVGTSVTSGGDGADTSLSQQQVVWENPHIKFFNGQRGYVRCTLTPEVWQADYRVLPYVKQPGALLYTRASFAVQAGRPGLQLVTQQAPRGTRVYSRLVESDVERIRAQQRAAGSRR